MAMGGWDVDRFASELTSSLVDALAGARDAESLEGAVSASAEAAEGVCRGRQMACGPGCPYCCVLNVSILLPEGAIIAEWLRRHLPAQSLGAVRDRLAAHRREARWMDDEARIFAGVACPFLDDGDSCSIHPVRPLVCRAAASLDRESCREAFRAMDPDPEPRTVPGDLLRQGAFDAAFLSLAEALRHHGVDDRSIELGAGVIAFLDRPERCDLLLQGERLPRVLWDAW